MVKKHNTIELNGNHYDANTGKILGPKKTDVASKPLTGKIMDGVSPNKKRTTTSPATRVHKTAAHHSAVHAPKQRPKTLMRKTVSKPKENIANISNVVGEVNTPLSAPTNTDILQAPIDKSRLRRIESIKQSKLITRFSAITGSKDMTLNKHLKPLAVKTHPDHITKPSNSPTTHHAQAPATHRVQNNDVFEKAMHASHSHEEPKRKKTPVHHRAAKKLHMSPKMANTTALLLSIALVGSFFAYQNAPNLSMKVASTRAGFSAKLPGYSPAGFSLNRHITSNSGEVLVSYVSNSDNRNFTFSQRETKWNSQDLLDNYVATNTTSSIKSVINGNTIYIYDDHNATWVNGGIWYEVEGNSSLNSDQLRRIVESI